MDSSGEKRMATLQMNPLLINEIIERVFEYLPLKDLKKCRLVCQEWNSVSTEILNEKSRVKLHSKERMTNFLEFYKTNVTEPFSFTSFDLVYFHDKENIKGYEQLIDFFNTLRENIITLAFTDLGERIYLTPLIEIATNLVKLTIASLNSVVELDALAKVKYLSLTKCFVSLDSFKNRIAPLNICFNDVTFIQNKKQLREILINDHINFSRCSEIRILTSKDFVMTFDMSRDVVSAWKIDFDNLRVINWRAPPANVNKRMLPLSLQKNTGMGIKQFSFGHSQFNLSVLPKSLEKLTLDMNTYNNTNCLPIVLPNLKSLCFEPLFDDTTTIMSTTAYDMGIITSMFRRCPKLVDMELKGLWFNDWRCDINVDLLPTTLKRIKLSQNKNIKLVGDTAIHVDSLILETATFADTQKFMIKIKPKIIAVELEGFAVVDPLNEIVSFVIESRNLEKVVIKVPGSTPLLRFYERILSGYVGDDEIESKCYEFTNEVGKRLTKEEFQLHWF